jgi:hypothetical protein
MGIGEHAIREVRIPVVVVRLDWVVHVEEVALKVVDVVEARFLGSGTAVIEDRVGTVEAISIQVDGGLGVLEPAEIAVRTVDTNLPEWAERLRLRSAWRDCQCTRHDHERDNDSLHMFFFPPSVRAVCRRPQHRMPAPDGE